MNGLSKLALHPKYQAQQPPSQTVVLELDGIGLAGNAPVQAFLQLFSHCDRVDFPVARQLSIQSALQSVV